LQPSIETVKSESLDMLIIFALTAAIQFNPNFDPADGFKYHQLAEFFRLVDERYGGWEVCKKRLSEVVLTLSAISSQGLPGWYSL
jgi:hypothetical protein